MTQSFATTATMPTPVLRERDMPHAVRMARRRDRQLERKPGFTPVSNKRVDSLALAALKDCQQLGFTGEALQQAVLQAVCRQLPARGFQRNTLRGPRPSKSDSAAYRTGEGFGGH